MAGQACFSEAGGCMGDLAPLRHAVHHRQQVADLGDLQHGALNARLLQHLAGIDQSGEIETPAGPQVLAHLGGELLLTLNPGALARWPQAPRPAPARAPIGNSHARSSRRRSNSRTRALLCAKGMAINLDLSYTAARWRDSGERMIYTARRADGRRVMFRPASLSRSRPWVRPKRSQVGPIVRPTRPPRRTRNAW